MPGMLIVESNPIVIMVGSAEGSSIFKLYQYPFLQYPPLLKWLCHQDIPGSYSILAKTNIIEEGSPVQELEE